VLYNVHFLSPAQRRTELTAIPRSAYPKYLYILGPFKDVLFRNDTIKSNLLKWIAPAPDHEHPLTQSINLYMFYTLHHSILTVIYCKWRKIRRHNVKQESPKWQVVGMS